MIVISSWVKLKNHDEHCVAMQHGPDFDSTSVISREQRFWYRIIGEALAIHTKPQAINRDKGLKLDNCWKPIFQLISDLTG